MPLHRLEGAQRGFEPIEQLQRADPAELARATSAQQVQADVGGRRAVCHHFIGGRLQVVGRKVVVLRVHAALEQSPGVARHAVQQAPVVCSKLLRAPAGLRRVGSPNQQRRKCPQRQQRPPHGPKARRSPCHKHQGTAQRQRRRGHMPPQRGAEVRDQAGLCCLGRGPLQQVPAAHGLPVHGAHDGIAQQQGLLGQQGQVPYATGQGAQQVDRGLVHIAHTHHPPASRHPARQRPHHGPSGIRCHHHGQRGEQWQAQTGQGHHQKQQRCGRHQRSAQIVQQLPAIDGREAPAAGLHQKRPQLPVAPRPAVQAGGGSVAVLGLGLHQGHVAHHGAAHQCAFEQVMAQHLIRRQASTQHGMHRGHMQQAFAGKAAFGKEVLVHVRRHGAVRVQPLLARKQPLPQRSGGARGQRCQHTRLQDAVALHDALACSINPGLVLGMLGHTHQGAQAARWELRIAVEREHIAGLRCQARELAQVDESARNPCGQLCHQLLQLAALALPANPLLLRRAVSAVAMQQHKTGCTARWCGVLLVQGLHQALGMRQQLAVLRQVGRVSIRTIGQKRELRTALGIGQVVKMQPVHQSVDGASAAEQRRNGHQHPRRCRDARRQQVARHVGGLDGFADEPVDQRHHDLGHGQKQQGGHQHKARELWGAGVCTTLRSPRVRHQPGQQPQRAQQQGAQVQRHPRHAHNGAPQGHRLADMAMGAQCLLQVSASGALQPVASQRTRTITITITVRARHPGQQRLRNGSLTLPAAGRQAFNAVQGGVARGFVFGREHGRLQHDAQHQAGLTDDVGPVGGTDQPQRRDRIAHAQLVRRLIDLLLVLQRHQVGNSGLNPLLPGRERMHWRRATRRSAPRGGLCQMKQEHGSHAALLHRGKCAV